MDKTIAHSVAWCMSQRSIFPLYVHICLVLSAVGVFVLAQIASYEGLKGHGMYVWLSALLIVSLFTNIFCSLITLFIKRYVS